MISSFLLAAAVSSGAVSQASAAASPTVAVAKLTAYVGAWSATKAGSALPASAVSGAMAFDDEFKTLSIGADGAKGVTWYAPIHPQLGFGKLAQPTDRQAISVSSSGLTLQTRNPDVAGDVDVNIESMDNHGHGFSITNGYIEARISLPAAHGSHSGFWMDSIQGSQGHAEIDFPETYGAADHVFASAVHWWPTAASRFANEVHLGNYWSPTPSPYGVFHTYGVLLTTAQICTYMDRKQIACIPRLPEEVAPFYILLSVFTDANRKDGYQPATMGVSYVRAWGK